MAQGKQGNWIFIFPDRDKPPKAQNVLNFMQCFFWKFGIIIFWRPHPQKVGTPSYRETLIRPALPPTLGKFWSFKNLSMYNSCGGMDVAMIF